MAKTSFSISPPKPQDLLAWYRKNARVLPWRRHEGRADTPYHTWLSEIMLQQTTVAIVIPYYMKFIDRWPHVHDLAQAQEDDVMQAWAGLGYYSRARNLMKCAKTIVTEWDGQFPSEIDDLKSLPGIGEYTANAIRAIAFDKPANVVDGNVERVVARIFAFDKPLNLPIHKKEIKALAASLAPDKNAGDYAQALMDLGATICTPRQPKCDVCPWQKSCLAFAQGRAESLPVIQRLKKQPERFAKLFILYDRQGHIFMQKRPSSGLLGGLWAFPGTPWDQKEILTKSQEKNFYPVPLKDCVEIKTPVIHVFSHFKLTLHVYVVKKPVSRKSITIKGTWFAADALPSLPTLMNKIWQAAKSSI